MKKTAQPPLEIKTLSKLYCISRGKFEVMVTVSPEEIMITPLDANEFYFKNKNVPQTTEKWSNIAALIQDACRLVDELQDEEDWEEK